MTKQERHADLGYSDYDICDMLARVFFPGASDNEQHDMREGLYRMSRRAHGVRAWWKFRAE